MPISQSPTQEEQDAERDFFSAYEALTGVSPLIFDSFDEALEALDALEAS